MATNLINSYEDLCRECMEIKPAGFGEGQSGDKVPHVYFRLGHLSNEITKMAEFDNPDWPKQYRKSQSTDALYLGWTKTKSYQDAVDLLKYGWKEGADKARELSLKIGKLVIRGQGFKFEHRPGMTPRGPVRANIGAIAAGLPDQYIQRRVINDRRMGGKIVRMAINVSASGSVDGDMLMNRAAIIMALSDALRNFGRQLEVTVFDTSGYNTGKYLAEWTAKPAGEPFDATKIVFAAGHPSTLRRIFFAMNEHVPRQYRQSRYAYDTYSYGCPVALKTGFPNDYKRFDIVIDSDSDLGGNEWRSTEGQAEWIMAMLARLGMGVEIEGRR